MKYRYSMKAIFTFLFLLLMLTANAQDDLLKELDTAEEPETDYTFATFKGTRIINGHSVETKPASTLEFIFAHRFGPINSGLYDMFGLDQAYVRLGLDYGITDNLSVSLGRNSVSKTVDGYLKYKLLKQQKGKRSIPVTITLLEGMAYQLAPRKNEEVHPDFQNIDRLAFTNQLLIARKFNANLSLQLMPTYVHKNSVDQLLQSNGQFALGAGGRMKFTKSMALTAEYYHNFSNKDDSPFKDVFGIGFDIETGGHVFQLVFTNAIGLTERAFITETTDDFFDGDIHFGFNVTRTFQFKHDK
jgi:hypothetical protein